MLHSHEGRLLPAELELKPIAFGVDGERLQKDLG
jgi:hypothetical protein